VEKVEDARSPMRLPFALALAIALTGALFSQRAPAVEEVALSAADRFEARMLERLNRLRARRGRAPLRVSPGLSSAASTHSRAMARHGFCGHRSPNGASFWSRISRFYRRGAGWRRWSVAENVLCSPRRLSAAAALGKWLASPGHRANLLAPQWREVGVGAVYADSAPGEFGGEDMLLVTAEFGVRQ
jgi:uncharacterized protein YkwD